MGPVTKEEYESRGIKYDRQLEEKIGIDPVGKPTSEKMTILRSHREAEYEKLREAVYDRRGWDSTGVPTKEKLKALGILFHDVAALLNSN
jgi:aldehyde:ferredoxin oxidoreductase